jgi:pimeloyl-ACP methyl ester carboxylesterase
LPGHGLTEVAGETNNLRSIEEISVSAIKEVIVQLKLGKCILIGNSLGGFIATK